MARIGAWAMSAAVVGGIAGGSALGLNATSSPAADATASAPKPAAALPDVKALQREVDALLAEDRALHRAVRHARHRLSGQVRASETSLRLLRQRLATAQSALARAQATRPAAAATAPRQPAPVVTPAAPPPTHASTGASGAGGHHGDDGGGHDD